jgi:hypothetical protein
MSGSQVSWTVAGSISEDLAISPEVDASPVGWWDELPSGEDEDSLSGAGGADDRTAIRSADCAMNSCTLLKDAGRLGLGCGYPAYDIREAFSDPCHFNRTL